MSGPSILDKPFSFEPYRYKGKNVIKLPEVKKTEQQMDFLEVLHEVGEELVLGEGSRTQAHQILLAGQSHE